MTVKNFLLAIVLAVGTAFSAGCGTTWQDEAGAGSMNSNDSTTSENTATNKEQLVNDLKGTKPARHLIEDVMGVLENQPWNELEYKSSKAWEFWAEDKVKKLTIELKAAARVLSGEDRVVEPFRQDLELASSLIKQGVKERNAEDLKKAHIVLDELVRLIARAPE